MTCPPSLEQLPARRTPKLSCPPFDALHIPYGGVEGVLTHASIPTGCTVMGYLLRHLLHQPSEAVSFPRIQS